MRSLAFREFKRLSLWRIRCRHVSRRDAHMALALMWNIKWLDGRIFGDRDSIPVIAYEKPVPYIAYYTLLKSGKEYYFVYPHRMERGVLRDVQSWNNEVAVPMNLGAAEIPIYLLAVAAHEVRHRLQAAGALRGLFSFDSAAEPSDPALRRVWQVERTRHWIHVQKLRAAACEKHVLESSESREEFDARFIEHLVLERAPFCKMEQELTDLVLLEPETAERRA